MTISTPISITQAFTAATLSAGEAIAQEVLAPNAADQAMTVGFGAFR